MSVKTVGTKSVSQLIAELEPWEMTAMGVLVEKPPGETYEQIADRVGCSPDGARRRVKKLLKAGLARRTGVFHGTCYYETVAPK